MTASVVSQLWFSQPDADEQADDENEQKHEDDRAFPCTYPNKHIVPLCPI
jgi:hypothetical protein